MSAIAISEISGDREPASALADAPDTNIPSTAPGPWQKFGRGPRITEAETYDDAKPVVTPPLDSGRDSERHHSTLTLAFMRVAAELQRWTRIPPLRQAGYVPASLPTLVMGA